MEKVYDNNRKGNRIKGYKLNESEMEIGLFDWITKFKRIGMEIERITVGEGVELDMQSVNGLSFSVEELEKNFEYIVGHISDGEYRIEGKLNSADIKISIDDDDNWVFLFSDDESLELDDLLSKKNEKSGH